MSTEPSLLHNLKKDKPPKQWCVYFDDDEGEVITVTNRVRDEMTVSYTHLTLPTNREV